MILLCWASAAVFPILAVMGGKMQPLTQLWQPLIIGGLFLAGQLFTLLAVNRGDVSIAAPVLGVKVLMVPAGSSLFVGEDLPTRVWIAAAIAVAGIACVQARDEAVDRSRIVAAIGYALLGALSMTIFDLLIQKWAPRWGAGYFLPLALAGAAALSLLFLPRANLADSLQKEGVLRPLLAGSLLMAIQAIGMTLTLGVFGDATRVNIVYSLRGVWGVVLSWVLAKHLGGGPTSSNRTMMRRLVGAILIGISVVISVT